MRTLWRQFWRFGLSGIAGLGMDVGVLYLALALGANFFVGRGLSFLAAVWLTWQINRRYTFHATRAAPADSPESLWREWWRYLLAMLGGGAVNYAASCAAVLLLPARPWLPMAAVCVGSLAGMLINFTSAKLLVFKR